jgi:hypothetical protein
MTAGHRWRPLVRANAVKPISEALIATCMRLYGDGRDEAIKRLEADLASVELWINDLYQVEVRRDPDEKFAHLNIRRRDGFPGRDWRHFQAIKNQLVGEECEAVELYPAESRLVDTSNKYHLWCSTDPAYRFPFGFEERDVQFRDDTDSGLRQRPPMRRRT